MTKAIKIEITSRWFVDKVLFSYESDDNNIKKTLEEARKSDADLRGANLYGADLSDANLYGANLYGANLYDANLSDANLSGANLRDANLYGANLRGANLSGADLRDADLRDANLRGADLRGADLYSADLYSADLYGANLRDAEDADYAIALTRILPEGDIIGYKRCRDGKIVKLLIPKEAKRSHAFGRKCRAEFAEVLEISKGTRQLKTAISNYDSSFRFKVGETVRPTTPYDDDWMNECSTGIHFFITKLEAEKYV